jgi:hypothetical protein
MMSQSQEILEFLQDGNYLTSLEALERFKCFRLASRISDLRRLGIEIQSEFIETPSGKLVKRYWIGEPPRTELEEMTAQANLTEETRINEKAVDRLAFEKNGQLAWLG